MALLTLDSKRLELGIKVGVLEKYQPDQKIRSLHNKVGKLKQQTLQYLEELLGKTESQEEALNILNKNKDKLDLWKKYLKDIYNPKLIEIIEEIKKKNKEICPKYDEVMQTFVKGKENINE